ncbi:MAG: RusA family crossover junction endodeoxyribonuclease [Acidimicrobiia bacterium]|nr:RusA family crossover junction endodeoxyribonuclease [Acidimicrobiia bacterium]MYF82802.1 RusA family crossover junction endodeoxyribonuclease [Acidimicrobiia bacterium]
MIEFVVPEKPRVQGSPSEKQWRDKVQQAAQHLDKRLDGPLRLRIDYFFRRTTDLDADNMIQPIQNALKKVLYEDDSTVVDVCARKINLDERTIDLDGAPECLRSALEEQEGDFVLITVAPAHSEVAFA